MRRPGLVAVDEMTTKENAAILGTLTPAAWHGFAVEEVAAEWYSIDTIGMTDEQLRQHFKTVGNVAQRVLETGRLSSGSIGGEHRGSLERVLVGAPTVTNGLSVPIQAPGSGQPQPAEPPKRRGL